MSEEQHDLDNMDETQIEEAARQQGWKPEDEWKGDPPSRGFVSAREFLEVGERSLPVVTKKNRELEDQVASLTGELSQIKNQFSRFKDFTDKAMERAKKERDDAIAQLQKKRAQAISDADGEAVIEAEREIERLRAEPIEDQTSGPPPEIEAWVTENKWYNDDPTMRALADGISIQLRQERPDLNGRAHLDELSERVKKAMPDKFRNTKRDNAPDVEGGRRTQQTRGRTWEDLPQDAKDAYQKFKKSMESLGKEYTKKEYLEAYEWD